MRRTLLKLAAAGLMLVGLLGVLHMPFARDLLRDVGGCPFPTTDSVLTAEEAELLRTRTLAPDRALGRASARPALGFELERTSRAQVLSWAHAHGVTCTPDRHGAGLRCPRVSARMLPEPGESTLSGDLMLGFTAEGTLVSVHYLSRDARRAVILARSRLVSLSLAPLMTREHGDPTLSGPLSQLTRAARYRDYVATVAATNMGSAFSLSENYQAFAN